MRYGIPGVIVPVPTVAMTCCPVFAPCQASNMLDPHQVCGQDCMCGCPPVSLTVCWTETMFSGPTMSGGPFQVSIS
ncbi:hypothetical protein BS17DRAFT_773129 [Gyrodon lividus]|nr:hypothetical protein BS17DRAFT_773129 [Gyrodon lividus]